MEFTFSQNLVMIVPGERVGLASRAAARDITVVREEADLDALITRIQSDLRSGKGPPQRDDVELAKKDRRREADLRVIRGGPVQRVDFRHLATRWLVPVLIFLGVLAATMLFDKP